MLPVVFFLAAPFSWVRSTPDHAPLPETCFLNHRGSFLRGLSQLIAAQFEGHVKEVEGCQSERDTVGTIPKALASRGQVAVLLISHVVLTQGPGDMHAPQGTLLATVVG